MAQAGSAGASRYEQVSRTFLIILFVVAIAACILAPIQALSWNDKPFPGFLLDQTLVVTDMGSGAWSGREAGLAFGHRVERIGGIPLRSAADYNRALDSFAVGERVAIFTRLRHGASQLFPDIELTAFPPRDLVNIFWMPYLVGFAYLLIGAWTYRVRGATPPGRALVFFCLCASVACALYFDVWTSHYFTPIWAASIAAIGGALVGLAFRFPQELPAAAHRLWLYAIPYAISIGLAIWAAGALYDTARPWAYLEARDATYRWAAISVLLFLVMMQFHAIWGRTRTIRQQARIVLVGSFVAFAPLTFWILSSVFGMRLRFDPVLYLPTLILFPLAVAVAIVRYRLLEMDALVNRTILWGTLTAVLAGVISVTVSILQKLFQAATGEKSDVAIVLTSLILVSVFTPVKTQLQALLDRTFKDAPDATRGLRALDDDVRRHLQLNDAGLLASRLLNEAVGGLGAQSGAISLGTNDSLRTVATAGDWRGQAWISAVLEYEGVQQGLLLLGPRTDGQAYSQAEFDVLQVVAASVAHALHISALIQER